MTEDEMDPRKQEIWERLDTFTQELRKTLMDAQRKKDVLEWLREYWGILLPIDLTDPAACSNAALGIIDACPFLTYGQQMAVHTLEKMALPPTSA